MDVEPKLPLAARDELRRLGFTSAMLAPMDVHCGLLAATTLAMLAKGIHSKREVGLLVTMVGAGAALYFAYNPENPPPRKRLIGGLLIGAAIAGLFLLGEFLI